MEKMQADSIMDEKKTDNNNDNNDKLNSSNKISPTIDEKNLTYDFYADTTNKQSKEKTTSPNYQQIDNNEKKAFTSEASDISNCLERKDSNISQKLLEENDSNNIESSVNDSQNLRQFISNVKAINSNNRIPISIAIENKSTSSLFKSNSKLTSKNQTPQSATPNSPGFQVVLLLEKSNSISFIVDFQNYNSDIENKENTEDENVKKNIDDDNINKNDSSKDVNGIVLFPIYQINDNNIYQNSIIQMKSEDIGSLSPIQLTKKKDNKRREFRKKDIISKLDPKYMKYEKLILDEIKRRKSNSEKNSVELNNYINNKLMKASILREKFYQKRRLNLKEKHNHLDNIFLKKKKTIKVTTLQKNSLLKSKKIQVTKKQSIDYTCIKESLLSSDSSSNSILSSSTSNLELNSSSENANISENNKLDTNNNSNNKPNESVNNEVKVKSNKENKDKNIISSNNNNKNNNNNNNDNDNDNNDNNSNNNNNNSNDDDDDDNNNNNNDDDNNNNNDNNNSINESFNNIKNENDVCVDNSTNNSVIIKIDGKKFDPNKDKSNKSINKESNNNSIKHSNNNSRKGSKNGVEVSENKISSHHHKHHHHRGNDKNGHSGNKKKLNEISTDLLDNISLYNTKLAISYLPPVTRYTLRELDTDEIITNPQLRHDLYFDPKLQFKPNTDGERGVQKKMKADLCWKEIDYEINYLHNYKRIPLLINEIKCILKEMISYVKDFAEEIDANIDIQLIAQEIKHGVFVPQNLISYIAKTLKVHCAPARDEYIDKIEELSKQNKFVETLKLIYEVLELMKLDLANHQLTRIRPYVLTHTVEFEWKFFKDQLDKKNISDVNTRNWLQMSLQNQPANSTFNDIFFAGFLKLLLTYNQNRIVPETFRLDKSRIVTFYNEWQDITILSCLLLIFRQACCSKCTTENILNLKQRLYVLLTSQSTSLKHINLEITNMAGQVRKKEYSTKEIELISGLIEKTLSPENKLYVMIQTRISTYIVHFLNNDALPKELMIRHNMTEMESEILTLSQKIKAVVELNLQTYSEYYKTIFLELKQQKTNSLIKTLNNVKNENKSLTNNKNQDSSSSTSINNKGTTNPPQTSDVSKMKVSAKSETIVNQVSNNSQNNSHDQKSNSQI